MRSLFVAAALVVASCFDGVVGVSPTDEYRDADQGQSGYLDNHNMDPAIVGSSSFGQLWKTQFNSQEQFYARPLTYTPLQGGAQIVFVASMQNYIRTINAVTGVVINSRQVTTPFLVSDIPGCSDITGNVGITGTPVIDPATDIAYFFAKSYKSDFRKPGATGKENGVYYFYAVDVNTLQDVPGFPILADGNFAQNDPRRYFIGGIALQRPSLTQIGSVVYAGFGSHCDFYNYTGYIMGVDIKKAQVVTLFSTQGKDGPFSADLDNGKSGDSGVWMSGVGLASDGNRIFYTTGNGLQQVKNDSLTGNSGWSALADTVVDMALDSNGVATVSDFFIPSNYLGLDDGDIDLGSGGLTLLDPATFHGGGVNKMAATVGKSGQVYILNADNLGGFKQGPGQTDAIIQPLDSKGVTYGAVGSYPLEGGFIYVTPECSGTYVYSLGQASTGLPAFTLVAQTNEKSRCAVGTGLPVVTTYKGQAGTAILWSTDPDAGLRAWHAVPKSGSNTLLPINLPATGGQSKWSRPAFGDGRVYITDSGGALYCLGAPISIPLNCTSPVSFGDVALGAKVTQTVSCTANIAITSINGASVGDTNFKVDNTTLPTGALKAGDIFTFPVTWDLTAASTQGSGSTTAPAFQPGIKSTPLIIYTTNAVVGYTTTVPITLTGNEVSPTALLQVTPKTINFALVDLSSTTASSSSSFVFKNAGLAVLTITGYAYTSDDISSSTPPKYTNVTLVNGKYDLGPGFQSDSLPPLSPDIAANTAITVSCTFTPVKGTGAYVSTLTIWTSGGQVSVYLSGSAATGSIATLDISDGKGGYIPPPNQVMNFGTVTPGSSQSRQIRICNSGGSALSITKSKPPGGIIHGTAGQLYEGQQIVAGSCATGDVFLEPKADTPNGVVSDTWIINCDDSKFGLHTVVINGTIGSVASSGLLATDSSLSSTASPSSSTTASDSTSSTLATSSANTVSSTSSIETTTSTLAPSSTASGLTTATDLSSSSSSSTSDVASSSSALTAGTSTTAPTTDSSTASVTDSSSTTSMAGLSTATTTDSLVIVTTDLSTSTPSTTDSFSSTTFISFPSSTDTTVPTSATDTSTISTTTDFTSATDTNVLSSSVIFLNSSSITTNTTTATATTLVTSTLPTTTATPTTSPSPVPSSWTNLGCANETWPKSYRALNQSSYTDKTAMTISSCQEFCAAKNYKLAGVEYGSECYCANELQPGSITGASGCDMPCSGNSNDICGGSYRVNVYQLTTITASPTQTLSTSNGYVSQGCYRDSSFRRQLRDVSYRDAKGMTVESCVAFCNSRSKPLSFAGVEYGKECYCGLKLRRPGDKVPNEKCNMPCKGNATETCGAANYVNIYSIAPLAVTSKPRGAIGLF